MTTSNPYTPTRYQPAEEHIPFMTPMDKVACTGLYEMHQDDWDQQGEPLTTEANDLYVNVLEEQENGHPLWMWWMHHATGLKPVQNNDIEVK